MSQSPSGERTPASKPPDNDEVNIQRSNHVAQKFRGYVNAALEDHRLWRAFTRDFSKWQAHQWESLDSITLDFVECCCYTNGLWIADGESFAGAMVLTARSDYDEEWSMERIEWVERHYGDISQSTERRKQQLLGQTSYAERRATIANRRRPTIFHPMRLPIGSPVVISDSKQQANSPVLTSTGQPQNTNQATSVAGEQTLKQTPEQLPKSTQSTPFGSANQYCYQLIQLGKIYSQDQKFTGPGDNFAFKLTIFYDKCRIVGLPPEAYIHGASIMLAGQAQTYFYMRQGPIANWDEFCQKMKLVFEGPEWDRLNLTKWQTMNIADTMAANPTLSTAGCLRKLCTDMIIIQRSLDVAFHGPVHLRANIIRACRGHAALSASTHFFDFLKTISQSDF